ncbi:MAG: hypothetical protein VZS44_07480 [Bacilli bacterium]|nr:hypothetical protein [Bacilli bacterium]
MNSKYEQFLENCNIISEDKFIEIVESLPEVDLDKADFESLYYLDVEDDIAKAIIDVIVADWQYAYCEIADFENKTFELSDIESLEDLEEIRDYFSKYSDWTIENYDDLKEELEQENKQTDNKEKLLYMISSNATLSDLEKIVKEYGYKK